MAVDAGQTNLRMIWEGGDELVLSLDPLQGHWTVEQYLLLSNQTNRLLEYTAPATGRRNPTTWPWPVRDATTTSTTRSRPATR